MASDVFVFDPTAADSLSKVRGIGRYMQILRENFGDEFTFVGDVKKVPADSVFINPFLNLIQNPLITKRIAKHQIGVIHDLIPLKYPGHFPIGLRGKYLVYKNKRLLHLYDRIITDSEVTKRDIVSILKIPAEKVSVVYPCLSAEFGTQATAPLPGVMPLRYFIYVGDVTWNKNIAMIAKAVKKADVPCIFIGKAFAGMSKTGSNPWLRELRNFYREVKGDKRFIFPGYVDNEALKSLYKHAVANILLSHDEGFGFSFAEAASQKTPSVLADTPVFREIAETNATFVNRNRADDIAAILRELEESPGLRTHWGNQAYLYIHKFKSGQFKQSLQSVIDSLT